MHPVESVREFGVDAFVTDRFNGVSVGAYDALNLGDHVGDNDGAVEENRRRVAEAIGVPRARLVTVRQVHGTTVREARDVGTATDADAIVSDEEDLALAILVADCLPVLLVDESSSRFAVVHAGWRGLAAGTIARSLEHFADARRVHAFVGPSISLEGYQVGPEVATTQLVAAGVPDGQVVRSLEVTDGGEVFFSDRAQRPCGRFALVAKRAS